MEAPRLRGFAARARFRSFGLAALAAAILAASGGRAACAGTVPFSFRGHIEYAVDGNGFGLSVGDVVTLSGSYDDADYGGVGVGTVAFGKGSGNALTLTLGLITLDASNDYNYGDGALPSVSFWNGGLLAAEIAMQRGVNGSPVDFFGFGPFFSGGDGDDGFIAGVWDATAVPEPSSVALMGIGLAGAVALARRRARG